MEQISIHGKPMPLGVIQRNELIELNLRNCSLYSQDLYILSMILKRNTSLTSLNLSRNYIGTTYKEDEEILELKMKNTELIQQNQFSSLLRDSLGLEHFAIAFKNSSRLLHLDLSENEIGPPNFNLLLPVFKSNRSIETLNLADTQIDGSNCVELCRILKDRN